MMWPLAEAAWRVAGLPLPRYRRSRIPVRLLVRRSHPSRQGNPTHSPRVAPPPLWHDLPRARC